MAQNVIPGGEYVGRSGNGMQRTRQTGRTQSSRRTSTSANARTASADAKNTSAVQCDIAEGYRRVTGLMYGGQDYYGIDGMFGDSGETFMAGSAYQQAVDQVKQAQMEADAAAQEEAGEEAESDEAVAANGYSDSKLEYLERILENMKKSREANSNKNNTRKRSLNYSHSKVSGAIMRAKSVSQANNALSSAKSNLISLSRKRGSKLYDSKEVEIAISHAKKMIRVARKKISNVKAEEHQKKLDTDVENGAERKHGIIRRQQHGPSAAAANAKIEKEMYRLKKMMRSNREQRKNRHRGEENQELLLADMEYLKRKIELMREQHEVQQTESAQAGENASAGTTEGTTTGTTEGTTGGTTDGTTAAGAGTGTGTPAAGAVSSGFEATV